MDEKILIKSETDYETAKKYLILGIICLVTVILFVLGIFFIVMSSFIKKTEVTVTDKRVYGKCPNAPQVNIPIKNISAVATFDRNKTLSVTAANGVLSFAGIKNYQEIKDVLLKLLEEKEAASNPNTKNNTTEEIKNLKELLDQGILTQEEFDAKKTQLLGL